jgi:2-methylcitrate dehydratase PrpD
VADTRIASLMPRIAMQVDPALGADRPPLTQVRVRVHLRNGRILSETADGARGYPDRPASDAELDAKFLSCATRAISPSAARHALDLLRTFERLDDVRALTAACG